MRLKFTLAIPALLMLLSVPNAGDAMEYQWRDINHTTHSLKESDGSPRILHFWASWCPPCRAELPALTAWERQHPDIALIPVSLDRTVADAESFLKRRRLSLSVLSGDPSRAMQLGVRALPTTIIIGANGKVLGRYVGAQPWSDPAFSAQIMAAFPSRRQVSAAR